MPIKLSVPFFEKEKAKSNGAYWDVENMSWYVPENKNVNLFLEWIDTEKNKGNC